MPSSNFKLFDENKQNMLTSQEYNSSPARLNGVQAGVASSQLQNKSMYQTSLMAYALGQMMVQQGIDADDSEAVADFVSHLRSCIAKTALDECFSKAQSLSSATAQKFVDVGLVETAPTTPDEALSSIPDSIGAINTALSGKAVCAYGHYNGAGNFGSSNPTIINLPFAPKFLIIYEDSRQCFGFYTKGQTTALCFRAPKNSSTGASINGSNTIDDSGKTFTFHSGTSDIIQFNNSSFTYWYFAIG